MCYFGEKINTVTNTKIAFNCDILECDQSSEMNANNNTKEKQN